MHRTVVSRLARQGSVALSELPPAYLAPSLHFAKTWTTVQSSNFSTTPIAAGRGRDLNRTRGVSAIHRTGPRFKLSASKYPLPTPVSPEEMKERPKDADHGLWAFFPPSREALSVPEFDADFGRPWAIQELREKSWDDLHKLWWVCVKERNRIASGNYERMRLKPGYGDHEAQARDKAVQITQKSIKHVLRERWYAWEDATRLYEQGVRPEGQEYGADVMEEEIKPEEIKDTKA
ncbi:54S ribosomal protein L4 [Penicillium argentinense]|uniref:Large ribosomal subunit protein uL29m n=1 Tax=Penicillium argentinense TaxID=1131581 RepID=A0A9W9G5V0_9EURO|nr:54S ribosomal protein L4 [Penicillium argentinense]KAJ5112534.1 54S ribosomal protein L4 [Penicillium argentinense]